MGADTVSGGATVETVASAPVAPTGRAAKLASLDQGKLRAEAPTAAPVEAVVEAAPTLTDPAEPAAVEAAPVAEDKPDPKAAKGIEAIEKRAVRERAALAAEKAAWQAERELQVAELARLRADLTGKASSNDDLKKLPLKDRYREALKRLDIDPDDENAMEVVSRDAYARSKSGKANPANKAYADQTSKDRELSDAIADLKRQQSELANEFKTRDQRAEMERFQTQYLDTAVKAIPADPSFIGLAHSVSPAKARASLLALGQRMERENEETPSHADVIAQYEVEQRERFVEAGLSTEQIDAMLRKPAPAKAPPPKSLDITARSTTQPINGQRSRAERIAAADAEIRKLEATPT